jgi:hypothetical protein
MITGAATAVVGFVFLGAGATRTFLTSVLPVLERPTGWIFNQSLTGLVSRLGNHSVLTVQPGALLFTVVSTAAALAVLSTAVWVTRPGDRSPVERGAEFGLGVTAMLLAGSLAWFPHFTHLLIPLFAAAGLIASRGWRSSRGLAAATVATIFVFAVLAPAVIARLDTPGILTLTHSAAWWPLLQLFSLPGIAAAWLLVALARSLRAPRIGRAGY